MNIIMLGFLTLIRGRARCIANFSSLLRPEIQNNARSAVINRATRINRSQQIFSYASLGGLILACAAQSTFCQEDDSVHVPPFEESTLSFDHYNGVTLHLDRLKTDDTAFPNDLHEALNWWKAEGRKGIWIHCSTAKAHLVPVSSGYEVLTSEGPRSLIVSSNVSLHAALCRYGISISLREGRNVNTKPMAPRRRPVQATFRTNTPGWSWNACAASVGSIENVGSKGENRPR